MSPELTSYEVLDLILNVGNQFDSIFSYWLSVSFAVIVGAFYLRERLSLGFAAALALMYAIAAGMFAVRSYSLYQLVTVFMSHATITEDFISSLAVLGPFRMAAFFIGCLATELYILYAYMRSGA